MSSRLPIVYLYPNSKFGADASRQTGLTRALAAHTEVVFVETAAPTRAPGPVAGPTMRTVAPNLRVVDGALGYVSNRFTRRLGPVPGALEGVRLKRLLARHGIHDYVLWLSAATPDILTSFDATRLVYDCIDPCLLSDQQQEFDVAERRVVDRAGLVFATAQALLDRMARIHDQAFLLNNAADPALYAPEVIAAAPRPAPLAGRVGPIIGYMGTVDWRVDTVTLTAAAAALPEYTFCIAGRINHDQMENTRVLRGLPNVVTPGAVSVEEGPAYNGAFDVGLIPYLPGYVGDAINPVKMYMYLSSGIPVVATWIREARANQPYVIPAEDVGDFVKAIRTAVEDERPDRRASRIAFAAANTWAERARVAIGHLDDATFS